MTPALGFAHFISQSDGVARTVLLLLALMSAWSWAVIIAKTLVAVSRKRKSAKFLDAFWSAESFASLQKFFENKNALCPFSRVTALALDAKSRHLKAGSGATVEKQDFLTRAIRNGLDEETARCESGLTALATIGSTAPFVGLFGTVWGVYHALVAIGISGADTLDKVAGPVGEALIMTGLGLAVAVPAVVGYNFFTRSNRVLLAKLDAFAYELFSALTVGKGERS